MDNLKTKFEQRIIELRNAETELFAELNAVQGAIREYEQFILPAIGEPEAIESVSGPADTTGTEPV